MKPWFNYETKIDLGGKARLPAIQALRGIAASLVVFHHFAIIFKRNSFSRSWIFDSGLGNLGACGVDIFFVISGFIMVYTTRKKSGGNDALIFLGRRILRIYPLYWAWTSLLVVLWLGGFALRSQHYKASYLVKSYVLVPEFNGLNFQPLIYQGWTLSFEMLFYVVFAFSILLTPRLRGGGSVLPFLAVVFAGLSLLSRSLAADSGIRHLLSDRIIIEFLFGVLVGEALILLPAMRTHWKHGPAVLMGIGSMALLFSLSLHDYDYGGSLRFVAYGIPSACIALGAAMLGDCPAPRLFVYLGNCSYSIYLTHGFFSLAYASALKHFPLLVRIPSDIAIIVAAMATITVSSFTYWIVEEPLTRMLSPKYPRRERLVAAPRR